MSREIVGLGGLHSTGLELLEELILRLHILLLNNAKDLLLSFCLHGYILPSFCVTIS